MKILEYLVTAPAANESYCVRINVPKKEVHHPNVSKGTGRDVATGDAKALTNGITGSAECRGDHGAPDGAPPVGRADIAWGCGCWGSTEAQVLDTKYESEDSSGVKMTRAAVPNGFHEDVIVKSSSWRSKRGTS